MTIIIWVLVWAVVCVMDEKLTPARLPTTRGQGHDDDDDDVVDDHDDDNDDDYDDDDVFLLFE